MPTQTKIITPTFRLSYAHIFKPTENDDGKKVWQFTGIFDKKSIDEPTGNGLPSMRQLAKDAGLAKWPKNSKGLSMPFRNGVEKSDENPFGFDLDKNPEYAGKTIVGFKSYGRPIKAVYNKVDDSGQRVDIEDESDLYSGCYCRAAVTCFTYDVKGKKGVSFGVTSIVKIKDGEPLINMADPTKEFASVKPDEYETENEDEL